MKDDQAAVKDLLRQIESRWNRGAAADWNDRDFARLSEDIWQQTGYSISISTLKRTWGRVKSNSRPSAATLDVLAQFAGYEDYRDFQRRSDHPAATAAIFPKDTVRIPAVAVIPPRHRQGLVWLLALIALPLLGYLIYSFSKPLPVDYSGVRFSLDRVTIGTPNTVLFHYDLGDTPYNKLELQQSWDERKRQLLTSDSGLVTTTYYEPGYFNAKLVVDGEIIRSRHLYVPTDGFQLYLSGQDRQHPVYLADSLLQSSHTGALRVDPIIKTRLDELTDGRLHLDHLADAPVINGDNFVLRARFRLTEARAEAICSRIWCTVVGTEEVYHLQFGLPGCIGELNHYLNGIRVRGRQNDQSAFGINVGEWVDLRLVSQKGELQIFINDTLAIEQAIPTGIGRLGGVRFVFEGLPEIEVLEMEDQTQQVTFTDHGS